MKARPAIALVQTITEFPCAVILPGKPLLYEPKNNYELQQAVVAQKIVFMEVRAAVVLI